MRITTVLVTFSIFIFTADALLCEIFKTCPSSSSAELTSSQTQPKSTEQGSQASTSHTTSTPSTTPTPTSITTSTSSSTSTSQDPESSKSKARSTFSSSSSSKDTPPTATASPSETSSSAKSNTSTSSQTGAIVGAVCGAAIVLGAAVGFVFFRKARGNRDKDFTYHSDTSVEGSPVICPPPSSAQHYGYYQTPQTGYVDPYYPQTYHQQQSYGQGYSVANQNIYSSPHTYDNTHKPDTK